MAVLITACFYAKQIKLPEINRLMYLILIIVVVVVVVVCNSNNDGEGVHIA